MTSSFHIPRLMSGGLITNYHCTSKCRHCLYNCSPSRPPKYIDPDAAFNLFTLAGNCGISSMHIGGGEPILGPKALGRVLEAAERAGVSIAYVETNSSWYRDEDQAVTLLERLKNKGLSQLLISISPFHMEYIPFEKVMGVIRACEKTDISIFPWMDSFIPDLMVFDTKKTHRFETLLEKFGSTYLSDIQNRYWIHQGGRALSAFRGLYPAKTMDQILTSADRSCAANLSDTSHFHMDLYGNYIPGLCAGLSVLATDISNPMSKERYPLL